MAESTPPRANLRVGSMVRGKYRIDAFIAAGSVSTVYAATHRNGSRVALKILLKDLARDTTFAERFRREGYFGNAVIHPGIVRAIDDDMTDDGCAFLVFELLEGETLEEKRQRLGGRLPLAEVLTIGDAVLDILAAAHDHQILHRDLKPDNVYLTRTGEVKLFDFGVARFNDGKSSSEMTGVGVVLGTPAFMAPEQAFGKREEVDSRSDVWAVGAMLFTCITGEGVHIGGDAKTKLIATARTKARSLRDVGPHVPRVVATVIDRALAFDKAERFSDAKSMRESLGWARRSLTGDLNEEPVNSEPETIRGEPVISEDEPTMIGGRGRSSKGPAPETPADDRDSDEETEKRSRLSAKAMHFLGKMPEIKRALPEVVRRNPPPPQPLSEGVITSAPPVTQREKPPEMPPSEGPTFSLRNDPIFALELEPPTKDFLKEPIGSFQGAPVTERLPQHIGSEPQTPRLPSASPDPAALFQAALERGLTNGQAPVASHSPRVIIEGTPLPAAIARAPVPLVFGGPLAGSTTPGSFGSPVSAHQPLAIPPPIESDPIAHAEFRVASVNQRPGPLLSQIAPKKSGSSARIFIPVLIGILAGAGTYVIVVRQRAADASHRHPPPTMPSAVISAAPPPVDAGAADAALAPAVIPPSASPFVSASASASSVTVPKPKPKPRPKQKPVAPTAEDPPSPPTQE